MKTPLFLSVLSLTTLLAIPSLTHASSDDTQIEGVEALDVKIVLTATTNAPAASGEADINSDNDNGALTADLEIKTQGLPPGDYQVSIVKQSDASTEFVGTVIVGGSEDESGDDNTNSLSTTSTEGEAHLAFPPDLNPTDVAHVIIADGTGAVVLAGDISSSVSNALSFNAVIQVAPGIAAPNAQGVAILQAHVRKGKQQSKFLLNATGIPGNTTVSVLVNGTPVTTTRSSKTGHVKLSRLPVNLLTVKTVELQDESGNSIATADF